MKREELLFSLAVILLSAGLVAASNPSDFGLGRILLYLYWVTRFAIEGALFVAFRSLLETGRMFDRRPLVLIASAFLLSLVPFVLATTAFDIVLGFPELGLEQWPATGGSFVGEFLLEIGYLTDDHLFLCLILSLPRLLELRPAGLITNAQSGSTLGVGDENAPVLPMLKPPLEGLLIRLEAQEHYVIIVAADEQRMVLGRFSDFISTLPTSLGLKVHRSHWVATDAAVEVFQDNRNMKLRLTNGDVVPVSRRYREAVTDLLHTTDTH